MFLYKVSFWDEIDETSRDVKGFVGAPNWAEAINQLIEFYGRENVVEVTLSELEKVLEEEEIVEALEN